MEEVVEDVKLDRRAAVECANRAARAVWLELGGPLSFTWHDALRPPQELADGAWARIWHADYGPAQLYQAGVKGEGCPVPWEKVPEPLKASVVTFFVTLRALGWQQ